MTMILQIKFCEVRNVEIITLKDVITGDLVEIVWEYVRKH